VGTTAGVVTGGSTVVLVAAELLEGVDAEPPDTGAIAEHPAVPNNTTLATSDAVSPTDRDRRRVMRSESNDAQANAGFTPRLRPASGREARKRANPCRPVHTGPVLPQLFDVPVG
jgi:hypothetical protein